MGRFFCLFSNPKLIVWQQHYYWCSYSNFKRYRYACAKDSFHGQQRLQAGGLQGKATYRRRGVVVLHGTAWYCMVLPRRYHEDVFGITITNHQAAVKAAQDQMAIKALAAADLAAVLARLDAGLAVDTGAQHSQHTCLNQ